MTEPNTIIENTQTEGDCSPATCSDPSRADHLQWCKDRALQYVDAGDNNQAYASMASDLGKHPETEGHAAIQLGMQMLINGMLSSAREMRDFINGFN